MTTDRKEATMLRKIWNWLNSYPGNPTIADRSCNFDCYDDGGCPNCSTWVEEWDPEYGEIGHWEHADDPSAGGSFDDLSKLDFMAELDEAIAIHERRKAEINEAERQHEHSRHADGYCECGAHVRGTDCYLIDTMTDRQLLEHTWTLGDRKRFPILWERAMRLSEES